MNSFVGCDELHYLSFNERGIQNTFTNERICEKNRDNVDTDEIFVSVIVSEPSQSHTHRNALKNLTLDTIEKNVTALCA